MIVLKAERYTHGVRLFGYSRETYYRIEGFLKKLELREPKKLPHGRMTMELKKKYYGVFEDLSEIYIHINSFIPLLDYLETKGVPRNNVEIKEIPVPTPLPAEFEVFEKYVLRDYQELIHEDITEKPHHSARVDLFTGYGKATSNETPVKIPGGWKPMGEIVVGDEVIARDGGITKVTGVYPQGKVQLYRITFRDGRSSEVCGEHLWSVYDGRSHRQKWEVINTLEIQEHLERGHERLYIPLCEPEQDKDIELPMKPYTLGMLLADGTLRHNAIQLSNSDQEVIDRIRYELPRGSYLTTKANGREFYILPHGLGSPYIKILTELGVYNKLSFEKFVPEMYLRASTHQRWNLLRGLMDGDGTVNMGDKSKGGSGAASYCSVSKRLAENVVTLVRSLGGMASISIRKPKYRYKGVLLNGRTAYQVNIRIPNPTKLFMLERKRSRMSDKNQYSANMRLSIKSVVPTRIAEATCISIDHPEKLFVIGDYVVTHNTLVSLYSAKTLGHRLLVMLPPKYFGLWEEALDNTYKDIQMRYVRVSGSPDLKVLIDKVQVGELEDVDVFLVSNITYRNYIEAFENNNGVIEQLGYNVTPLRFHELLGIGLQINDEIQEDPGLLFRIDMYTNVAKQIYLSATPFTGNDYVTKMIDVMLPESTKVRLPKYKSYIDCVGVLYSDISIRPKDYLTPFKNTYNHARYETIMRDRSKRLKQYFEMIDRLVEGLYSKDRLPGQKLLILCSTVAFIELMVEHLTKRFTDLVVYGYTSGSSYEKLLESDITVSTIKSAGTGVDIPNLREVLLCQATDSKKDSIQILGRLRPLKDFPDVTPRLTYLCCENIPHHCRYARNKEKHLEGRTKSMVMRRIRM